MWNCGPIDFEAERDGQEFQAKSGVARVVAPYQSSSQKLSKCKHHLADNGDCVQNFEINDATRYSKVQKVIEKSATQLIPIIFAVFINLLDACTFGSVFFPSKFGSDISGLAIELFLLSTVIVQLVLIRMSSFSCGLGTSMAENIPFVHSMATGIFETLEHTHTFHQMIPTVLITVCLSTIINGFMFYIVGYFKMGNVLHFFPRHVIMGMTAGFGVFLISTAVESSTGIVMAEQTLDSFLQSLSPSRCCQLLIVVSFESVLRLVEFLKFNELVVPCMMFLLPIAFYVVLVISGTTFQQARGSDWLFPETASANWWDTWNLFDFSMVEWNVVATQWTTMSSLAFFTLILVPIRIPSLSIITEDEVNFDEELKAQGIANILSGLSGAVHNYLSYSNSIFFFYVGGRGKESQMAVTLLTLILFFIGPQIINYVPRLIAGVIMLHLGVDLIVGALLSSRKALDSLEYSSVLFIATVVSFLGFVPGICMGVVSACVTFVVQSSRQSSIRAIFSGDTARSNTSWSSRQRDKLEEGLLLGSRVIVVQLQGHLFFGNVQQVVAGIENALMLSLATESNSPASSPAVSRHHVRYLILDCSFVTGADVNAVSGLLKMRDQIEMKYNNLIANDPHDVKRDKNIQVGVVFAGLQCSLEAMFSIQDQALMEHQSDKKSKELEKNGKKLNYRDVKEISGSTSYDDRDRAQTERDDVKHPGNGEFNGRLNVKELVAMHSRMIVDTDISGYESTHTFDSYSSKSDYEDNSSSEVFAFLPGEDKGEKVERKTNRSPSWGSTSLSSLIMKVRSSIDGNILVTQSEPSIISARLSEVPRVSETTSVLTPQALRPNPILRMIEGKVAGKEQMGIDVGSQRKLNKKSARVSYLKELRKGVVSALSSSDPPTPLPFRCHTQRTSLRLLSRIFYSDVNTALQAVEERIIKSTPMPKDRISKFNVRRSLRGKDSLHASMSAELKREDFVHSPEASISSLEDYMPNQARLLRSNASPSKFQSSAPTPPVPINSVWKVGLQSYSTDTKGSESSPLLLHPIPSAAWGIAHTARQSPIKKLPSLIELGDLTIDDKAEESYSHGIPRISESADLVNGAVSPIQLVTKECTASSNNNGIGLNITPEKVSLLSNIIPSWNNIETNKKLPLLELVIPSQTLPKVPHSPLSPSSRHLKIRITNMLYDLSSQWTLSDSSALKRLARRLRKGVILVKKREVLWESGQDALHMGMLIRGRLKAVLRSNSDAATEATRTLQVILPGTIFGELGLLSRGRHSRTIIASADSKIAILSRDNLDEIEETDKALLCVLQHLALRTAAGRSHELMLFSAGSLGP